MSTITIAELQRDPSSFLAKVAAGEVFTLSDNDRPIAEIKPLTPSATVERRPFGLAKGDFVTPTNFDAPLPEELLDLFEGSEISVG